MLNNFLKLSILSRYYIFSIFTFIITWSLFSFLNIEFINLLFVTTAFIWHFTLLAPSVSEVLNKKNQRFSFLVLILKANHYLQMFLNFKNLKIGTAIVRGISPFVFLSFLVIAGGSGQLLFSLIGSFCFELFYFYFKRFLH